MQKLSLLFCFVTGILKMSAQEASVKWIFKNQYEKLVYERYKGNVIQGDANAFRYGCNVLTIQAPEDLLEIFRLGIFYPAVITGEKADDTLSARPRVDTMTQKQRQLYNFIRTDSLGIANVKELTDLSKPPKIRRFMFWLWRLGWANPTECYFELTNEAANKDTDIRTFIIGAALTYYKVGTIII